MYEMLSSNLRGGMSFASQRYAESAVFQDMMGVPRVLDPRGRHSIILDIDANSKNISTLKLRINLVRF